MLNLSIWSAEVPRGLSLLHHNFRVYSMDRYWLQRLWNRFVRAYYQHYNPERFK